MPYAEVDDVRLHIRQRGSGKVALFVHGFPLDSSMWIDQVAALSDVRRCVAVDLRGFGRSTPVDGAPLTMERHAEDLAGVLDLVSEERADIIGLSMGGYVALAFAEMYPERVRSLALIDTKSGADSEEGRSAREASMERVLETGRSQLADDFQGALLGPSPSLGARARLRSMVEACPYETIIGALGGMRDRPDRTHMLAGVAVPSAVIVGEHDALTPVAEGEAMAEALPDSHMTVVPDAGHMSPIENPRVVNDALRTLLTI